MKERLDVLLVKRNLAASREKAKAIIMSGIVYVDGQKLHFRKKRRSKCEVILFHMSAAAV